MQNARSFDILPAIDLRGGRVVRLAQGDFDRETAYEADPIATALEFATAGAAWMHVVDFDAARTGVPAHRAIIATIARNDSWQQAIVALHGLRGSNDITNSNIDAVYAADVPKQAA